MKTANTDEELAFKQKEKAREKRRHQGRAIIQLWQLWPN
jgi:hypothetical protein